MSFENGNNISQVTDPETGITYAINTERSLYTRNVSLITIQRDGSWSEQAITLPQGYRLVGRGGVISLNGRELMLTLAQNGTGRVNIARYMVSDVTTPVYNASMRATGVFGASNDRFTGCAPGTLGGCYAVEFLRDGSLDYLPLQNDGGYGLTAFDGDRGFGYAGWNGSVTTNRQDSFIYEAGVKSDPFSALDYESASINVCSRFGRFCYGNVTDPANGDQMWMVNRVTNELTSFVDEQNNLFAMTYYAGAREDGWVFGYRDYDRDNDRWSHWAANLSVWGNVVKPFETYCTEILLTGTCGSLRELNRVTEYFDEPSGEWRANFAGRGSFFALNAVSGEPIYGVPDFGGPGTPVPEPSSLALIAAGFAGLAAARTRRKWH